MLLSVGALGLIKWIFLFVVLILAVWIRATPAADKRRTVLLVAAGLLGIVAAFSRELFGTDVVIVTDKGGEPSGAHACLLFSRDYTFADQHKVKLDQASGTLVVNDTKRELALKSFNYGFAMRNSQTKIAPNAVSVAPNGVDFLGPHEPPPAQVESDLAYEIKYWLTW